MKTKLIAFITAGAIATSGLSVAPAQADPADDLARFLVGAALIGFAVEAANRGNSHVSVTHGYHYKPKPRRHNRRAHSGKRHKPRKCLRQRWTDHGWKKYYARKCMAKFGWHKHGGGWHKHGRRAHQ